MNDFNDAFPDSSSIMNVRQSTELEVCQLGLIAAGWLWRNPESYRSGKGVEQTKFKYHQDDSPAGRKW